MTAQQLDVRLEAEPTAARLGADSVGAVRQGGGLAVDSVSVANFRCFGSEQTARLAPITLLVGENGTGKSSLMAMVRILWDVVYGSGVPNFSEEPFDLGGFDEIVHASEGSGMPDWFCGRLTVPALRGSGGGACDVEVEFASRAGVSVPVVRRVSAGGCRIEPRPGDDAAIRPYVSDPVRSRPRRTYDPGTADPGSAGDAALLRLGSLALHDPEAWFRLKERLEAFGRSSGLFEEIRVQRAGDAGSDQFAIQVRTSDDRKGQEFRNIVDAGTGVSHALPIAAELVRADTPQVMMFQQPDADLHPRAASALGTLLCEVAALSRPDCRVLVEAHSEYLADRIRMSVRDGVGGLQPDDVSILFFERTGAEAQICSMGVDQNGNLTGVPNTYGQFMLQESRWLFGLS